MKDDEQRPEKPALTPPPAASPEGERRTPQRLTLDDLDRVAGGNHVMRNTRSPFDTPPEEP